MIPYDEDFLQRFWDKVDQPDPEGCWEWQASTRKDGYGQIWHGGSLLSAHRVAYETYHGPLGPGLVLRHTCDNPRCCNPQHLLAGTQEANMRDMTSRGRDRFRGSRSKSGRGISL